mmetsp:Transcript_38185/g.96662  ORF Transcript_38185/g.96662 Transcript_38185/m.96662 type:complete len:321 (+) Transcript_38185:1301-2263(+)
MASVSHTRPMAARSSATTSAWPPRSRTRSPMAMAVHSVANLTPTGASGGATTTAVLASAPAPASRPTSARTSGSGRDVLAYTQRTSVPSCPRITSSATSLLPAPDGPITSMDVPRPSGVSASRALTPVTSASLICSRSFMPICVLMSGRVLSMPSTRPPALLSPSPPSACSTPTKSTTCPNTPSPAGASNASYSFLVMGPLASSITCSTPLILHSTPVPVLMSAAPPSTSANARLSERCHSSTPVPPVTKDSLVPSGASAFRPMMMARESWMNRTLPKFTLASNSRSVASWLGAEIRLLKILISWSQSASSSSFPRALHT